MAEIGNVEGVEGVDCEEINAESDELDTSAEKRRQKENKRKKRGRRENVRRKQKRSFPSSTFSIPNCPLGISLPPGQQNSRSTN